ncbi:MAG TPA: S-methyl-5'-thioinosine phosphorylase [Oleiagrimonas sp.]|nr:S-methyl-5'-thioinosine phosphorylase [Oleiagrimonas sp.]
MSGAGTVIDFAVIGGTGFYKLAELTEVERKRLDTPFGEPSADILLGNMGRRRVAFLARHGEAHTLAPHRVNYRANLWALHHLGVSRVLAVNAVGGIRADMGPRCLAMPEQLIDYTWGRIASFADVDGGEVRHVDFSEPYSADWRRACLDAAARAGMPVVDGGCYGVTQGPRLETRAEIARMRRDGCDMVGMTGMPEAVLARELDMAYACLAVVANWAAGCDPEDLPEISLEAIFAHLEAATAKVPDILRQL